MQNTENRNIGALQLYTFSIFRRKIIMINYVYRKAYHYEIQIY